MSEIKVNSIKGVAASDAAITINNTDGTCTANITNNLSNRNLIINGAMQVAQRGTTSNDVNGYYHIDRFRINCASTGTSITTSQETDAPAGFHKSLKYTVTSAASSVANSSAIDQRIEGNNIAHLNWGTSDAKGVTLSFHVKCSVANLVLGGAIVNGNFDMAYPFTYTTNGTANTWTKYTIYIPGPTTGTWPINNGLGIRVIFNLGSASARLATANVWANSIARGPTGAGSLTTVVNSTFFLTGVQLEVGSVATDFEHKSFGQELSLCHRYYYRLQPAGGAYYGSGFSYNSNSFICHIDFPVPMRANVTALETSGTAAHYKVIRNQTTSTCSSAPTFLGDPNNTSQSVNFVFNGSLSQGEGGLGRSGNALGFLGFSAEL